MALKTLVKVSEVNNLSDARYCAGMGVDLVGFSIDKDNEKRISPENYKVITGWIEGVNNVLEFNSSTAEEIIEAIEVYQTDYIQICNEELVKTLFSKNISQPLIFKINLKNDLSVYRNTFESLTEKVSHFLIESDNEDIISEKTFNELKYLTTKYPIIIGFGISTENLEQILTTIKPIGIALKGGDEIRPGYKDFDELADILEELELD